MLAQEALAGLASKENFSKVSLRKAESFHGTGLGNRHLPHMELMLLHVKGQFFVCQKSVLYMSEASSLYVKGQFFVCKRLVLCVSEVGSLCVRGQFFVCQRSVLCVSKV